ncbi:YcgN family cysteine cluster protein [Asticcacaulis sp. EMRT-3]|uniref:YcgN family cysteine cluster protein n=1 Tax=Asticcacaulis sp. EMRT-3 TaxID=3040349 RepID=UPI0024AFF532|nr:YcgN family cysteine cluster protein [Asticcacaulis sp. EMRT-3]MDI7775395.1 YcgN family cysteine cluster protein [Asticcacaulis sp. EMRT-3]
MSAHDNHPSLNDPPFWETKTLEQMNAQEWESLCDGCGLCCLVRFEDEDTGDIIPTRVHCKLFDPDACACSDYAARKKHVPDCIKLTPHNIENLLWMPKSCAYRRLHEGKPLPQWHYLITGDRETVHQAGVSIRGQTVSELALADPEDALDFIAWDLQADRSDWDVFED